VSDNLWEFTFTVKMGSKAYTKLCDLEWKAEHAHDYYPEWSAGLAMTDYFRRHGVKMKLTHWRMGRPRKVTP
jgi:hypothetical protein